MRIMQMSFGRGEVYMVENEYLTEKKQIPV